MCGVFGVISAAPIAAGLLEKAQALQMHRGPDAQTLRQLRVGHWHVGLAHQRLAIIDLSAAGAQPMLSPSGRSLLTYNGEVYNYLEIRSELERRGVLFRTRTDTEVIAAACEEYGIARALQLMDGMWAFVWIDLAAARIFIARDRFGVKPMYLHQRDGTLAFGSEIKTLVRALELRCTVNLRAVATYLRLAQQDTNDETFFEGVIKLTPGHYAEIDGAARTLAPRTSRYWQLDTAAPAPRSEQAAVEETRALLGDAVRLRLRSDVPVGLLLSGGVDSSAIAALLNEQLGADGDVTFISAVSDDPATDESHFIHTVGQHLARPIREVRLEFPPHEILPLIGRITEQCDEPIGSFSCVAQNLLMQRARELGVTVLLSGQGADEVFCGYRKYAAFQVEALLRAGHGFAALRLLADFMRQGTVLNQFNMAEARRYLPQWLVSRLPEVAGPALEGQPLLAPPLGARSDLRERQRADVESLSIPVLTHWEDRNSMAWSREVRNPFLDYRLVHFGVNLPMTLKIRSGWTKYVLRRAVASSLPPSIVWRRDKRGFTTPEARMLRNELRGSVDELLSQSAEMVRRGLVNPQAARARFALFLKGASARSQSVGSRDIFQLLSLECWLRAYRENLSG
ncbi:MAG TPA: asparagine synthase (glutamine-hydrolyzing) [Steroidobacteraceae bacterium]|jgi:asparagine synthase (glutamine-hydrolysing)|nr:asparagine synthase (glutamine-hydrolyzing) [Steroidobacteraceae bacterium]